MTGLLNSEDTVNNSAPDINVSQSNTYVNNNSMQKSKNNSGFNETNTEKYQSRTSDLDNKYLNAVNSGDIETA